MRARAQWRTSKHAHCGVTCVDCHRGHYNVPPGTPATTEPGDAGDPSDGRSGEATRPISRDNDPSAKKPKPALAPRHFAPSGRSRAGRLLSLPLRHAGLAADRRPAPDLRPQRLQLHHLPRSARTDQGIDAEGPVPVSATQARPRWPGTRRSTTSTAWPARIATIRIPTARAAVREHQPYQVERPKRLPMSVQSRRRATSAIRRSTP